MLKALLLAPLAAGLADPRLPSFERCATASVYSLNNFLGRTFAIRSCLESGFINFDLTPLKDATMNASLARILRTIYSTCIRTNEQTNYFLGFMANINAEADESNGWVNKYPFFDYNPNTQPPVRSLLLGVGNTISSSFVISRPYTQDLTYYTPALQVSTKLSIAAGGFNVGSRPWFTNYFKYDRISWRGSPGWYSFYPDASIKGQNDSTICFPASTLGTVNNSLREPEKEDDPIKANPFLYELSSRGYDGALICLDFKIPFINPCGGYSFVLRNWGADANYLFTNDSTHESVNSDLRAQIMTTSQNLPAGLLEALIDALWATEAPIFDFYPRRFPTEHFKLDFNHGTKKARLFFYAAGTHGGVYVEKRTMRWYLLVVRYVNDNGLII